MTNHDSTEELCTDFATWYLNALHILLQLTISDNINCPWQPPVYVCYLENARTLLLLHMGGKQIQEARQLTNQRLW